MVEVWTSRAFMAEAKVERLEEALSELIFAANGLVEEKYLRDARTALSGEQPK
jgi:hypothetical protein